MQNKELVIQLIQVDLKHNQLTEGLRHLAWMMKESTI